MAQKCLDCGELHFCARDGYCLSLKCAGHYTDPDYPRSMPAEMKAEREAKRLAQGKRTVKAKAPKIKMPRKGTRRSIELWYESQDRKAPWLEKGDDHA